MFDLDREIAAWRRDMISGKIGTGILAELEQHLRDDFESRTRAGAAPEPAFQQAVENIGPASLLHCEFGKIGETSGGLDPARDAFFHLAGIPQQYVTMNATTATTPIEPRWATYLKSFTFALPAMCLWPMSVVFLMPKLLHIAQETGQRLPSQVHWMLLLSRNAILIIAIAAAILLLLEWRSKSWPKYRRMALGAGAFAFNAVVLLAIFTMVVAALLLIPSLLHH